LLLYWCGFTAPNDLGKPLRPAELLLFTNLSPRAAVCCWLYAVPSINRLVELVQVPGGQDQKQQRKESQRKIVNYRWEIANPTRNDISHPPQSKQIAKTLEQEFFDVFLEADEQEKYECEGVYQYRK
jgi:hypothetical protein